MGLYGHATNDEQSTYRTAILLDLFWGIRKVGTLNDGSLIFERPYQDGSAENYAFYAAGDNGGEVQVWKLNTWTIDTGIASTSNRFTMTAETMAYRIAQIILGRPIEWDFQNPITVAGATPLEIV